MLRWTQPGTEMSRNVAIGGTQGDDAAVMSALLQVRDAPRRRMNAKSWRECMPMDATHLPESVLKRKGASAARRAADHAAAHQQCCFPEFIALRNMVVMPWLARLSTCGDRPGCHDRPSIAMHFVMQTIVFDLGHRNGTLLADP
ncbi:hypothetical protein [Burkholderia lata]|uniref:hypothetical protein n=1 Tax=Burkholderia lata (strain ATCC 17760 / DSM 23089 / LMG 22485 / NCIMB 9086 / R18194 / 383) TaxID=482957 RepID=UPI001581E121|nr:hypothetical protein [Burkholderia lata]